MSALGTIVGLASRSLYNRRGTAFLTMASIAISVALLLGVERIRSDARSNFASTIAATDLIVSLPGVAGVHATRGSFLGLPGTNLTPTRPTSTW